MAKRSAKRVQTRPPSEFVQGIREYGEKRRHLMQLGNDLLVAVGVFLVVWTSWMVSANWEVYTQEPWRAVVGGGGVVLLYLLALALHRKEIIRVEAEVAELKVLERRLTLDEPVAHKS